MQDSAGKIWEQIDSLLRSELSRNVYERWFASAELESLTEEVLCLRVPNSIHHFIIESNYLTFLNNAIMAVTGKAMTVKFLPMDGEAVSTPKSARGKHRATTPRVFESVQAPAASADLPCPEEADHEEGPATDTPRKSTVAPSAAEAAAQEEAESVQHARIKRLAIDARMNRHYVFDEFVVGAGNEFAQAAAIAVANAPAKRYNPLFFYGGSGLGKTHLLQAIGLHVLARNEKKKVVYLRSEEFTNEFIDAIQNGSLVKFRKKFRHADVLLIDDIQFLAGKERSQEEFFHTFNVLFDGHKQIVLGSDRPPSEINQLEHRLVSRFEWGLTAEIQPPDVETRHAILRKKAQTMDLKVEDEVLGFLAERIRSNVRRLEGALTRIASFASLSQRPLTLEEVENLLKDFLQEEAGKGVTVEQIQRRVAKHYDMRLQDMSSKRRPANIAFPRQIAMYLCRDMTNCSLAEIGEEFGGRDHGTVLHACKTVKEKMKEQPRIRQEVTYIVDQLRMGIGGD